MSGMRAQGDFEANMRRFDDDSYEGIRRGLKKAGLALLRNAVMEAPTVPKDEGTLRGSGSVHVNGKPEFTSADLGITGPGATPVNQRLAERVVADYLEAVIGFNTPYAAYQHEGIRFDGTRPVRNYTEPSSHRKFLERAMHDRPQKYYQIVTEVCQKYLRQQGW